MRYRKTYISEILPFFIGSVALLLILMPILNWQNSVFVNEIKFVVLGALIAIVISLFLLFRFLPKISSIKLRLSKTDISILLFAVYVLFRAIAQFETINQEFIYICFSLIVFFVFFRQLKPEQALSLLLLFPLAAFSQIIYGIYIQYNNNALGIRLDYVKGVFFNTGIFGGFIAIVSVITLGLIYKTHASFLPNFKSKFRIIGKAFLKLGLIIFLVQLFASHSRAAWLACFAGFIFLFASHYNLRSKLSSISNVKKLAAVIAVLLLIAISLFFLYNLKKESAKGRILIWEVSAEMVKEKPIFGHGINRFQADYMEYQAKYFQNHPDSTYAKFADDNLFAFNEFIRVWVELGAVGLFLMLFILYQLFIYDNGIGKNHILTICRASLFALVVFGFFSYPLAIFRFQIIEIFFIAVATNRNTAIYFPSFRSYSYIDDYKSFIIQNRSIVNVIRGLRIGITLIWFFTIVVLTKSLHQYLAASNNWDRGLKGSFGTSEPDGIVLFDAAYPVLNKNGFFLSTYGKALNIEGESKKAVMVLKKAISYLSSSGNYTELGKSYRATGNFENARNVWIKATYMVPSKFTPDYLLAKMLYETGKIEEARYIATKLLHKEIKVWSPLITNMLNEMEAIAKNKSPPYTNETLLFHNENK